MLVILSRLLVHTSVDKNNKNSSYYLKNILVTIAMHCRIIIVILSIISNIACYVFLLLFRFIDFLKYCFHYFFNFDF